MPYLIMACQFVLATVFLLAGFAKLFSLSSFARAVRKYRLLPPSVVTPVAFALPPLEVSCGVLLFFGVATTAVSLLLACALVAFTAVVGRALAQGRVIECGCFGPTAPKRITWTAVARNVVLLGMTTAVAAVPSETFSIAPRLTLGRTAEASLAAGAALPTLIAATSLTLCAFLVSDMSRSTKAKRLFSNAIGGSP